MSVTGTYVLRDLITDALRKAGVTAVDEAPTADDIATARDELNRIMKAWQAPEKFDFMRAFMSVTATTSATYTLSPVRPLWLDSVRWKRNGQEIPMIPLTRQEYDDLPNKAATGVPTQYHYNRQAEAATLIVWPVPASVTSETIEITYQREFADVDYDDVVDLPGEWWNAAVLALAAELSETYQTDRPNLPVKAAMAVRTALAGQSYGSVFFGDY